MSQPAAVGMGGCAAGRREGTLRVNEPACGWEERAPTAQEDGRGFWGGEVFSTFRALNMLYLRAIFILFKEMRLWPN